MKQTLSKKKLREFGILMGIFFPLFFGWLIPFLKGYIFLKWSLLIGLFFLIIGIAFPRKLIYPYRFWTSLGNYLGWINSRIILGMVFIFIVQPIALIMKIIGYDPLNKKPAKKNSFREIRDKTSIDLSKIF